MEANGCLGKFPVSLRKKDQYFTEFVLMKMSRRKVSLDFTNIDGKEFEGVDFYMGLSYFVWLRYSMMCES